MGSWIRIENADPIQEDENQPKKKQIKTEELKKKFFQKFTGIL
jgi:hypothetical protein